MDLKQFIVDLFPEAPENVTVIYGGRRYFFDAEPRIADIIEDLEANASVSGDLDILVEVPAKKRLYRRRITLQQVSPLALPEEERPEMPIVAVAFNPVSLAPEQVILQDHYGLPVVRWSSVLISAQNQWPPFDQAYGIPVGSYRLEVQLPELPNLRRKTAEILVSLSPDLNMGLSAIRTGSFSWDYSVFSASVDEIDPDGYSVFQLIMAQVKNEQTRKVEALLEKEFQEYQKSGSFGDANYSTLFDRTSWDTTQFQISRNMVAYRYLYFVENAIRGFVWSRLQVIYAAQTASGPKWWMACLPEDVRNHIREKMSTRNPVLEQIKGETTPLHYCSFNEVGQIVEKDWMKFFKDKPLDRNAFFGHMSYLEHIRNAIAHTRPLGPEELHILYSNGGSVLTMLGIQTPRTTYASILGPYQL